MINGMPIDVPATPVSTPPRVAHVLNDAILLAARDLSKRPRDRRKIIFVISDGREQGSTASYADTLKVLLTQNITVYAVGVEGAAIPVYDRLQLAALASSWRDHVPPKSRSTSPRSAPAGKAGRIRNAPTALSAAAVADFAGKDPAPGLAR